MPPMRKSDAQPKEQRLVVDGEVEEHEYPEQHGVAGHEREQLDGQVGEGAAQCFPRRRFFCSDGSTDEGAADGCEKGSRPTTLPQATTMNSAALTGEGARPTRANSTTAMSADRATQRVRSVVASDARELGPAEPAPMRGRFR